MPTLEINLIFMLKRLNIQQIKTTVTNILLVGSLALIGIACQRGPAMETNDNRMAYDESAIVVDTIKLQRTVFRRELVSNGKLRALSKSDLKFKVSGQLEKLAVKNGDVISNGKTLAMLNQKDARQKVMQAEINLKKAKINLEDALIGHSGRRADSISFNSIVYESASLSSGYADALLTYENAKYELESTELIAPFRGKVANLTARIYEQVSTGNVFCTLIDDSEFHVEFYLLESEIELVSLRDEISIVPFAQDKEYLGYVSEINPVVNDKGMVLVKGTLRNPGSLWEGMNVKVHIGRNIPGQLVVPKSAVVLRQGQEVLFTYENGKVFWIYITILSENSSSYAIKANEEKNASLEPGAFIITSGNLNLAHKSEVEIRK